MDKLETIHPQLGKFDFLEAKRKRDWAYAKGIGSKEWIEFSTLMFEQFPFIFNTCLAMNDIQNELELSLLEKDVQLEFCDDKRISTIRRYKDKLKTLRQQLAEQPNVDVLVETLRVANSALDTCKINIDHSELEQHSFEFDENAVFNAKLKIFAALATYQSKNEKE